MSDPGDIHSARSPELQALLDEIAAEAAREEELRTSAEVESSTDTPVAEVGSEPLPEAEPATQTAAVAGAESSTAIPLIDLPPAVVTQNDPAAAIALARATPRRPRRAMALAGGAAAAVVAIVAIAIGNGSAPAAPPPENQPLPDAYTVIASVGPDGQSTDVTVTAPMTTAGGRIVALSSSPSGATFPVSPAGMTASSATVTPTSPERPNSGAPAGSTNGRSSVARSAQPRSTRASRPAPVGGDAATVVTGTSKLTGWAPIPTTSGPAATAGQHRGGSARSGNQGSTTASSSSNQDTPTDQAGPASSLPASGFPASSPPTQAPAPAPGAPGTVSATSVCIAISLPPVPVPAAGGLLPTSVTFPCP